MLRVIKQKEKNQEIVCSVVTVGQNKSHHGENLFLNWNQMTGINVYVL